ncbi:hypothetical protein D0C36_06105 [Mucilaginibacter conchicola]|uniref:Uncharacterized protein n=1 Tax=Mucilaginibacter conchicola TaxID=2303333 RepID=A0A372P029_9SPHI|nr:hypothetical protein [Mucilaginibacter conchicola]RFZ95097.1 hypothetical protein D0C36_06105 [Mucilaginibacter conchicola]
MKILPRDSFTIYTSKPEQEVRDLLDKNISYEKYNFLRKANVDDTYFSGYIVDGFFDVKRRIQYRNPFLPQIRGVIKPMGSGSTIKVEMEIQGLIIVFMSLWICGAASGAIATTISLFTQPDPSFAVLFVWLMPLAGYAMAYGGFSYERNVNKEFLLTLVDGQID